MIYKRGIGNILLNNKYSCLKIDNNYFKIFLIVFITSLILLILNKVKLAHHVCSLCNKK
jgi:hypothetical protein